MPKKRHCYSLSSYKSATQAKLDNNLFLNGFLNGQISVQKLSLIIPFCKFAKAIGHEIHESFNRCSTYTRL
jgi:hypothetical protein